MCKGRATRIDEILVEFWKNTDKASMEWLIGLFNTILRWQKCPMNGGGVQWFLYVRTR